MDNFEMTKIAGAVLSALLLIFGTKEIIEMRSGHDVEKAGYSLPGTEPPAAAAKAAAQPAAVAAKDAAAPAEKKMADAPKTDAAKAEPTAAAAPAKSEAAPAAAAAGGAGIVALLSKANADNGKAIFGKCKSCHIAENGKPSTVGPNLWGVVNRAKGTLAGYANYSEGMKAKGGNWTFEDLSSFLTNPKAYVTGTKMGFAGLTEAADRADVIAYLATLADTPVALPK